ncbi:Nitroreductase family protein [Candidatus Hepatincolaceae symbiont of Richtersius coronifer]
MKSVDSGKYNEHHIKSFLSKPIADSMLTEILKAAQGMVATCEEHVSVVVVQDNIRKQSILEKYQHIEDITKNAPVLLIFIADFYKTNVACEKQGAVQEVQNGVDSLVVSSFDAGMAMAGGMLAAEKLGLGAVPIYEIREDYEQVSMILELPKYTLPLVGLCIGYPNHNKNKKPKLPLPTFKHEEKYQKGRLENYISAYDEEIVHYLKANNLSNKNWTSEVSDLYKKQPSKALNNFLIKQKFGIRV